MGLEVGITLTVLVLIIIGITVLRVTPYLVLCGALGMLVLADVINAEDAFAGFGNKGVITVALLFIVADGLNQTGGLAGFGRKVLGDSTDVRIAQLRTMGPVAFFSAFLNNTPVVAIMLPLVIDWAKKHRIAASSILMPLSFAAILGRMCTLIGTSTTLVINSQLPEENQLGFFELAWIGVPATLVGIAAFAFFGKWLLPNREAAYQQLDDPKEYTVEMQVEPGSALTGKSIEEAGLRSLPDMYLMEVARGDQIMSAVSPDTRLEANDQLVFVGIVDSVVDLQKIPGLKPATDQLFKLKGKRSDRILVEAVVSNSCPYVRMTIKEARFRTRYGAAVIAVNRDGVRLRQKIGDIELTPGDTLLLECSPAFLHQQRNSRHFFLVSELESSVTPKYEKAWVARLIMAGMVLLAAFTGLGMLKAALIAAGFMIVTRCIRGSTALRSVEWDILLVMAAGIGIGDAIVESRTHIFIGDFLVNGFGATVAGFFKQNPRAMLGIVCALTMLLNNLITAKAAGLVMLPIAQSAATQVGTDLMPFAIAVIVGAATSLATPIGYQTNLMVYGPGGYKASDFLRAGGPLTVVVWLMTVAIAPLVWPFAVAG